MTTLAFRLLALAAVVALAAPGCIDVMTADSSKYVERVDKQFPVTGTPDLTLSTFDGSIEVRAWDKPEVQVVIEKRGASKEAVDTIEILAEQNGDRISVAARVPKSDGFGIHFHNFRGAKLIVSAPANTNLSARSGDGSIDVERLTGRFELRSGDGSIRGRDLDGEIKAHTGDGSIKLEAVTGTLDISTGDGAVSADGKLTVVRARTGDGSVVIRAASGSSPTADWDLTTGDGSITLEVPETFNGELDAHTGDGTVRMTDVTLANVTGTINKHTVRGRLGSGGRAVRMRTGDGSITLKHVAASQSLEAEKPER